MVPPAWNGPACLLQGTGANHDRRARVGGGFCPRLEVGHVEHWRWQGISQEMDVIITPAGTAQMNDFERLRAGVVTL